MISKLLLNNELQAALRLGKDPKPFDEQLLRAYDRGDQQRFFSIFNLLTQNAKLEFYLRVYFLIYTIHPYLKAEQNLSKEEVAKFKQYLDSKGCELTKSNQFIEFYALPFIKNPLKHEAYRNLFKKEWVSNLREKVVIYSREEIRRMKAQSQDRHRIQENPAVMSQLSEYIEKYRNLEEQYRASVELANNTLMQSQNKWFQITKDLVNCSKSLIQVVGSNSKATTQRKFLNIKKKIDKYEKFVNKKIEDMITQSQDISIFDRPSINELSCTITQYTQKNITTLAIDEYIPTDFLRLKETLVDLDDPDRTCRIIKGLIWRVVKSKDSHVRRMNVIGMLMHDTLGIRTNNIQDLLSHSANVRNCVLRLMFYIEHDYYGRNSLFSTGLVKDLIFLLKRHYKDSNVLQYVVPMLQTLSVRQDMILEMIELDIVRFYLKLLSEHMERMSENAIENIVATLLNLCNRPEGLDRFEKQEQVFHILGGLLECRFSLIKVIVNGLIYTLLGRKILYDLAMEVGLNEVVSYIIEHDASANIKELRYLEERLIKFEHRTIHPKAPTQSDDKDEIMDEDSMLDCDEELSNLDEYIKAHDYILSEYMVSSKETRKQISEVRQIYELTIEALKKINTRSASPHKAYNNSAAKQSETKQNKQNKITEKQKTSSANKPHSTKPPASQVVPEVRNVETACFTRGSLQDNAVSRQINQSKNVSKPREKVLKKINEQIRASKFSKPSSSIQQSRSNIYLSNNIRLEEQVASSVIVSSNKKQATEVQRQKEREPNEYERVFASKPKIQRSPRNTPEKYTHF